MYNYSVVQWIFFFYFYCFFGWCFESTYVSVKERKLVNRGFMKGPFLPLYGSGAIMMLIVSMPFKEHLLLVYLAGCVGATLLEYITGVTMEALFKVRYWDYSKKRFQFQGHICLSSTLAWGALTLLMTQVIQRQVEVVVLGIPAGVLTVVTYALTALLFADFALSFKEAMDLRDVLIMLEQTKAELERIQKRMDVLIALTEEEFGNRREEFKGELQTLREGLQDRKEAVIENIVDKKDILREELLEKKEAFFEGMISYQKEWERGREQIMFQMERRFKGMLRRNPTMASKRFREGFEEVKQKMEEKIQKSKRK